MSLISHQVEEIRRHAHALETGEAHGVTAVSTAKVLRDAAWTIEQQGLKIQGNCLNDGWVPVEKELPDIETPVIVSVKDTKAGKSSYTTEGYYNVERNKWYCRGGFTLTLFEEIGYSVTAWQPRLKPYEG